MSIESSNNNELTNSTAMRPSNQFGPIFRALLKSRLGAILIVLQVALTLAIVANMVPVVSEKISDALRPSGVDDRQLVSISTLTTLAAPEAVLEKVGLRHSREYAVIMRVPGVENATNSNTYPNSNSGWSSSVRSDGKGDGEINTAIYLSDERALATLGASIIAGRNFDATEIIDLIEPVEFKPKQVIITETLGKNLFPNETNFVGKRVSMDGDAKIMDSEVIGVVADVARPWPGFGTYYNSLFVPYRQAVQSRWIVRAKPGVDPAQLASQVVDALAAADRSVIYDTTPRTLVKARQQAYADSLLIAGLLACFSVLVLVVTALGIVGLAYFWITQRMRQIGIRRALGASAGEITWYFRQENLLLTGAGCVLGVILAYALNYLLSQRINVDVLHWRWVLYGVLTLLLLGQLAITAPARRAGKIAPALATRS